MFDGSCPNYQVGYKMNDFGNNTVFYYDLIIKT